MFTINVKRSVGALAVMAGLLAVAGPASASPQDVSIRAAISSAEGSFTLDVASSEAVAPRPKGSVTVDMAAEKLAAAGGYGDRATFTLLEDRPQRGLITNGTGDDEMTFYTQQGQVPQRDRVVTMLDHEGTPVTTYSPKESPQAYMTDVIWQDNFVRTVVTDVIWQDTVD